MVKVILLSILLSGCSALKPNNIIKTGTTTAVTYAIAGPIPAIANLAVSATIDEILPEQKDIKNIKTKEQAVAHVLDSAFLYSLYGLIAFLLITNVLTPYVTRKRGYNAAKQKYKKSED